MKRLQNYLSCNELKYHRVLPSAVYGKKEMSRRLVDSPPALDSHVSSLLVWLLLKATSHYSP